MRLFDNAARLLQSLAADRGLLVFVDDVHWADQGTLSLLHYLLRHLRGDRVLFLVAYREIELDRAHPLASALVEWNRERLGTRVALGRLTRADTGALLATLFGVASVSDELASALYRETEGNPFFIEEVIKSLIEQGQIYRDGDGWGRKETHELAIPQSVKEAIGRRLEPAERADGGRAADGGSARARSSRSGNWPPCRRRARTRCSTRSTRPARRSSYAPSGGGPGASSSGSDDSFAFTHDKIREVLYEELNPIRRRRLHQRIGETLETLHGARVSDGVAEGKGADEHAQDLAHHFMQAGDLGRSLAYARRAAQQRAADVRARRGAQVPGPGARIGRGAARDRRTRRHRRADRRRPGSARHDPSRGRELRARAGAGDRARSACGAQGQDRHRVRADRRSARLGVSRGSDR